jgi:hypothetical protein
MFITALFTRVKLWNQLRCSRTTEQVKKVLYTYICICIYVIHIYIHNVYIYTMCIYIHNMYIYTYNVCIYLYNVNIYTVEYYTAVKRNEIMSVAGK